jgi:hypothetical protein
MESTAHKKQQWQSRIDENCWDSIMIGVKPGASESKLKNREWQSVMNSHWQRQEPVNDRRFNL